MSQYKALELTHEWKKLMLMDFVPECLPHILCVARFVLVNGSTQNTITAAPATREQKEKNATDHCNELRLEK